MNFALFLGCNVPTQTFNYEAAARTVIEHFGIKLTDIPEFGCCGEFTEGMDYFSSVVFSARNIVLAEQKGLDIVTLCNGCFSALSRANHELQEDEDLKSRVNDVLEKLELQYQGKSKIYHFHQLIYDVVGDSKIKKEIKTSLQDVSISCHNGCHILKPSDVLRFDDPEEPKKLEELVALTGARVVRPMGGELCCGSFLLSQNTDYAYAMAAQSIERKGNVDAIIVGCPFCFKQLDIVQIMAKRKFGKTFNVPILFYAQLLGLAMGHNEKELGLDAIHKISTAKFLEKVKQVNG
jgi:heterodisulfide reductase subunit B